jgi:hypothetical protein
MNLDFPLRIDASGRTAATGEDDHIRDLIEQVLFTAPGERVNRPDFGTGLLQLVFAPAGQELATATQFLVKGALQQWLGELILVQDVSVKAGDASLVVRVAYRSNRTQEDRVAQFSRDVP